LGFIFHFLNPLTNEHEVLLLTGAIELVTSREQIKVYMSIPDINEPGGPISHLPELVKTLNQRHDISLLCFVYGNRKWGFFPRNFCATLPGKLLIFLADLLKFIFLCVRHGSPDVLHLNSAYEIQAMLRDIPYMVLCKLMRCGCIIKTHGSNSRFLDSKDYFQLQAVYFRFAQIITFLSTAEADLFRDQFPSHSDKIYTSKNIFVPFSPQKHENEFNFNKDQRRILFGGRFVNKKNISKLLNGFSYISNSDTSAHLILAGSGPLESKLRKQANKLGIDDRLTWTGWVDRHALSRLYASSDITIFTSTHSEGMPMTLLESLGSQNWVVTTSILWTQSYNISNLGVVFLDSSNSEDIAKGLAKALSAKSLSSNILKERKIFLEQFSAQTVGEEFVVLYRIAKIN